MGIKPARIYTDKNNAYPGANGDILKAKHGIMHIAITPVEHSHVPVFIIKTRLDVTSSSVS